MILKLLTVNANTVNCYDAEIVLLEGVNVRNACDTAVLGSFVDTAVGRTTEDGKHCHGLSHTALVADRIGGRSDRCCYSAA